MIKSQFFTIILSVFIAFPAFNQEDSTLAERLGYSKNDKLLIIHADDLGVSHSENQASLDAFKKGMVNSGSVMVPCPWVPELAAFVQDDEAVDLGIHLTVTAEWKYYKWSPVLPNAEVPTLVNEEGVMYDNCNDVVIKSTVEDVEKELRAQVQRALDLGIDVTHLDSHMGCLFNPKFIETYLKLGEEFNVPVMLARTWLIGFPFLRKYLTKDNILLETVLMANPKDMTNGNFNEFYTKTLKEIEPGVSLLILHTAYDNAEMQAVTIDHPDYGAAWRQADVDFFTSKKCKKLLKKEGIKLVQWKDIRKLIQDEKVEK